MVQRECMVQWFVANDLLLANCRASLLDNLAPPCTRTFLITAKARPISFFLRIEGGRKNPPSVLEQIHGRKGFLDYLLISDSDSGFSNPAS